MVGGAEFGPVKYPRANPIAENGTDPATRVPSNFANVDPDILTPPRVIPRVNRARTTTVLNTRLVKTFAVKYANGGIGLARFTSNHPSPRSDANPAAVAK